jgi:hypothetical protein
MDDRARRLYWRVILTRVKLRRLTREVDFHAARLRALSRRRKIYSQRLESLLQPELFPDEQVNKTHD